MCKHNTPVIAVCSACLEERNNIPHDITKQKHYVQFKIQPLEFSGVNGLDFLQGNIIKYVCRFRLKNGVEDLKKARHYLDCLIEREERGTITL